MAKILIVYHSQTGNTERMAKAVAEGAAGIEGAQVVLKRAGEATLQDLLDCQGLAVGTPENFGTMSGMIKDFFDRTYYPAQGKVFRKPYVVFISAGNDGRGRFGISSASPSATSSRRSTSRSSRRGS